MKNKKLLQKILLHIVLPLFIGLALYLFGRDNTWLNENLHRLYINARFKKSLLYNISVFNLPDFCWDYSFASALFIWEKKNSVKATYFPIVVFLLLIFSEAVQVFFPNRFTFDWFDILAAIFAFVLSCLLNYYK